MRQKGIDGELLAENFLKELGYRIIDRNFHSRFGEVDIVALDKKTVVFVEVKLRTNDLFGTPLEAITHSKIEKIKKTAYYFLTLNKMSNSDFRLDAIEILVTNGKNEINHVKNITL